jgi:hypothetical protein
MSILIFPTQEEAASALASIEAAQRAQLLASGCAEDTTGRIVPVNAASGEPDFSVTRTTCWDTVKPAPDGRFWFYAPGNPALMQGIAAAPEALPPEWEEEA